MKNPAMLIEGAMQSILNLKGTIDHSGLDPVIGHLTHLRISQINGCAPCVDMGWKGARKAGQSDERLFAVAAWREAPYYTDAERAALALAEHATRLADHSDPVPDAVWEAAKQHFNEQQLAALVMSIGLTNLFNRLNVTTAQVAGAWG
jgi:AhpD family alkylhydroperoxidase